MIQSIFVQRIDWHGITVEVSYEADWLNLANELGSPVAHLQVRSVAPERAQLPISETGYKSHFPAMSEVVAHGGPLTYVREWLDQAATLDAWKNHQDQARQFALF